MAIAPALLLALFAFAAGTLPGGARFLPAAAGAAALLAATLFGAREFLDPLRLGRAGRVLLWASGVAVLASLAASPVPRAGFEIALLLPALAVLPAAVARCLGTQARRRTAITAVAALVAAVAIDGLVEKVAQGSDRAAMPLGHHVPFAAFLVLTAPVAALALRGPALSRFLGGLALVATVAALVVARSWLAGTAAAIEMLLAARLLPRVRQLAWGLAFLGAALLVPRAERLLRGGDPSFAARAVYVRAALAGAAARPVLGWGPGSTAWTLPLHERPRPGVNPPGEAVGDALLKAKYAPSFKRPQVGLP